DIVDAQGHCRSFRLALPRQDSHAYRIVQHDLSSRDKNRGGCCGLQPGCPGASLLANRRSREALMSGLADKRKFYINGAWVAPSQPRDLEVIDPSTEEPVAVISLGDQADTDAAVAAAKAAFPGWSRTSPAERLAYVERILEIYKRRASDMAAAITAEMGAPQDMSLNDQTAAGSYHIETFIEAFRNFEFIRPLGPHAPNSMVAWEPVGVVGLITPWNWPMNQVTLKVIPALLAGDTVVLKPSEIAPLS